MPAREIRIVQSGRPFAYQSPFPREEHTLLLCALDESVSNQERMKLAGQIVAAKCRYAVCWGHKCSEWDDAIDYAHIQSDENFDPPEETLVMTTWHENQPIKDTVNFWWLCTDFENYESTRLVVFLLGEDEPFRRQMQKLTAALR